MVSRLHEGFERIAFVLRSDLWAVAHEIGLNPAQAQVLVLLHGRPDGLRPKAIAAHLGVSAASVADTVGALVRKNLVRRGRDPDDARAAIIRATRQGMRLGADLKNAVSQVAAALSVLPPAVQDNLLLAQIALIRQLQIAGAIPLQRMCVSCHHFRPYAHDDAAAPHHCAFVDAAFGNRDLRLDCAEYGKTAPEQQAAVWTDFAGRSPQLQAHPPG